VGILNNIEYGVTPQGKDHPGLAQENGPSLERTYLKGKLINGKKNRKRAEHEDPSGVAHRTSTERARGTQGGIL